MNTQKYDELLSKLSQIRAAEADALATRKQLTETLHASPEWKLADSVIIQAGLDAASLRAEIERLALEEFNITLNKHPHEKIEIKIFKSIKIMDTGKMRDWVMTNLRDALKVDERKVEKYAKEIGPIDGVTMIEEPRVQIASQL